MTTATATTTMEPISMLSQTLLHMDSSDYTNFVVGDSRDSRSSQSPGAPADVNTHHEELLMRQQQQYGSTFTNVQSRLLQGTNYCDTKLFSTSFIDPSPTTLLSMADMQRVYEKDTCRMWERIAAARLQNPSFRLKQCLHDLDNDSLLNEVPEEEEEVWDGEPAEDDYEAEEESEAMFEFDFDP
jgi:hypothetical protein